MLWSNAPEPGFVRIEFQSAAGYDLSWFDPLEIEMGPFLDSEDVARAIEFVIHQAPHVHSGRHPHPAYAPAPLMSERSEASESPIDKKASSGA
jgi:hypothetical protein